jgi:hypothetical protein
MNHKYIKFLNHFLFSKFIILFITAITLLQFNNLYADESEQNTPKVNMGAGGLFGFYDVNHYGNDNMNWEPGFGYGGGLVFESMFTNTFGLHSGLWFYHCTLKLNFPVKDSGSNEKIKHTVKTNMLSLPIYLITSFYDSRIVTFNILAGLNFSYIAESYMKPAPDEGNNSSANIQKDLGYGQIGAGAGIEFLFKITKFSRIFITFTGEYYFVNLISDKEDDSVDHMYNVNVRAGIMLCTF